MWRFFEQEEALDLRPRRRSSAEARNNDDNDNNKSTTTCTKRSDRTKTTAKEIRKEHRGRHSYSNFHYITWSRRRRDGRRGWRRPPSQGAAKAGGVVLDAPTTLGCVVLLGMTYAYFKEKMVFSRNFSRTNFKEEEKRKTSQRVGCRAAVSRAAKPLEREFRKTKEEETTTTTTKTGSDAITNTNSESVNAGRDDTTPDASTAR